MAYPYLQDIIRALSGVDIPLPIPTFGLWLAIAIFAAFRIFKLEIQRKEKDKIIFNYKNKSGPQFSAAIPDFAFYTVFTAMIGARLFHILEYPHEFVQDPWGMIFSRGGFTVLGALLFGTIAGVLFAKHKGYQVLAGADAAAPAMILGYAVGRIGCQLSGDGDWGIPANMALKPGWLPDWFWAQQYHNNVIGQALPPPGVYPTPMYESLAGFLIFFILWGVRKKPFPSGWFFSLYLLLSGIERFLLELIRVNSKYELFGLQVTQAELISTILMLMGVTGLIYFGRKGAA